MREKVLPLLLLGLLIAACSQRSLPVESKTAVSTEVTVALETMRPTSSTNIPEVIPVVPSLVAATVARQAPTITPTVTPLPTVPPIEARQMVEKLLSANSFCRLPCIGGITPGKTKMSDALASLSTFATQVKCPTRLRCEIRFLSINQDLANDEVTFRIFRSRDALDDIDAILGFWSNYSVQEFLADYGQPSEIYFDVTDVLPSDPENYFTVILHYATKGISASFDGITGKGSRLKICPSQLRQQVDRPFLVVWKPTSEDSFSKIYGRYRVMSSNVIADFNPLEDYGGMTVKDFYTTYKDPANKQLCYEIDNPWQK